MYASAPLFFLCVLSTAFLTGVVRWHALRVGVLDLPNARSSHERPTPRGGGIAMVATSMGGVLIWEWGARVQVPIAVAMGVAALVISVLGYLDDRYSLPAGKRFTGHLLAAAFFLVVTHREAGLAQVLPALPFWLAVLLMGCALVWAINFYNFMDGIDGLAASQALFVGLSTWWLCVGADGLVVVVALCIAGAALGFLFWNWAPAAIFMGDVGSGFLGFCLGALAVLAAVSNELSIWTSVALSALFLADATATLLRRAFRGQRWHQAHRSHAYQILSRRWQSHAKVTAAFCAINVLLILPVAVWIEVTPDIGPWVAMTLLVVLGCIALRCGAGLEEAS